MAFQTGTSSSIENLLTQLSTFAQANGWTQQYYNAGNNGTLGLSKNSIHVAFRWEETAVNGTMILYQSLASDPSPTTQPWTATGDTGIGYDGGTVTSYPLERCVNQFGGPHTGYYFFENDANPAYIHVVVEIEAGRYRHFGIGEIDKIGDWVGGEYCYGHYWEQSTSYIDQPAGFEHGIGLDCGFASSGHYCSMRVEGMPEYAAGTKWGLFRRVNFGNDPDGDQYVSLDGGWRGGPLLAGMNNFDISESSAYKPLVPIPVFMWKDSNPDILRLLGYQADVRMCNIGTVEPGQIINISGDNWYFFPWTIKKYEQNDTEESWNAGVAYRRVDA